MTIDFMIPELTELHPKISVMGVGGAGGNAVNNMIRSDLQGVDFIVANTDAQALAHSRAEGRIQLGAKITQGLGAGSQPQIGMAAAEESLQDVMDHLDGCHMLFITAGMGGGTGTGAAPIIAKAARDKGILTVGVVTKPFHFEGKRRLIAAEAGIGALQDHVDTLIIIPNQNLFRIATEKTTFQDAFAMADDVLHSGVRGITDLMVMPGLINLDFADVRTVMSEMGKAMMGTGEADGEGRARQAAEAAVSSPLLDEVSLQGAKGVLINITGGMDLTLFEVDEAANLIRNEVDADANIKVGAAFDETLNGQMRVSVVATGIEEESGARAPKPTSDQAISASVVSFSRSANRASAPVAEKVVDTQAAQPSAEASDKAELAEAFSEDEQSLIQNIERIEDNTPLVEEKTPDLGPLVDVSLTDDAEPVLETADEEGPSQEAASAPEPVIDEADVFVARTVRETAEDPEPKGAPDPFAEAAFDNARVAETGTAKTPMASEPARSMSLFERLTGAGRGEQPTPSPTAAKTEGSGRPAGASFGRVASGDRPAPSSRSEDQLEIPAFLRRQAN